MTAYVKLLVADSARSRRFYEQLGFSLVHGDDVFSQMRWAPTAFLYLVATPPFLTLSGTRGTGVLLCFKAGATVERPSLAELLTRAQALGATTEGPTEQPWHTRELIVVDPDGYRVNFVEPR